MARRAYWGDLRLQRDLKRIKPVPQRGNVQIHQGLDRKRALVVPSSPNYTLNIAVECFWGPETDFSKSGFRARELALISALITRADNAHPLFYVEDDLLSKTVSTYVSTTVTTTSAHGYATNDRVLIRRLGEDLYTYGSITVTGASTFTLGSSHSIANGDEVHKLEAYWPGCVVTQAPGLEGDERGDFFQDTAVYGFVTDGTGAWSATTVDLD